MTNPLYSIVDTSEIDATPCPCGSARRAFIDDADQTCSMHIVEISEDARTHYHKKLTEIYYILEGSGQMELDGDLIDVIRGMSVMIKPGCRHRAIGKMKIINFVVPAFDPDDEWFD